MKATALRICVCIERTRNCIYRIVCLHTNAVRLHTQSISVLFSHSIPSCNRLELIVIFVVLVICAWISLRIRSVALKFENGCYARAKSPKVGACSGLEAERYWSTRYSYKRSFGSYVFFWFVDVSSLNWVISSLTVILLLFDLNLHYI